jgi:soluble lytic murein transglycosylase
MYRIALIVLLAIFYSNSSLAYRLFSNNDNLYIKKAVQAYDDEQWSDAILYTKKTSDKNAPVIMQWLIHLSKSSSPNYAAIKKFYDAHPTLPLRDKLKVNIERSMLSSKVSYAEMLKWYKDHPPETTEGMACYLRAILSKYGVNKETIAKAKKYWVSNKFSAQDERFFQNNFGSYLTKQDYIKKIDWLIWGDYFTIAKALFNKVDVDYRKLFVARIKLSNQEKDAYDALVSVPEKFRTDPGLVYNELVWYKSFNDFSAIRTLFSYLPNVPEYQKKIWKLRVLLAREFIEREQYRIAYELAANHKNIDKADYAEAEWLSGWVALRFLNNPSLAKEHFSNMHSNVSSPISKAKSLYWIGRAEEASRHDSKEYDKWYGKASNYIQTFYGQLAITSNKANKEFSISSAKPHYTKEDEVHIQNNLIAKAAYMASLSKNYSLAKQLMQEAINNAKTKGEVYLITSIGKTNNKNGLSVEAAKYSFQKNVPIFHNNYILINDIKNIKKNKPLVHAIIRQESLFEQSAISSAGAVGLMQIMPDTARNLSRKLSIGYNIDKLKKDKQYNATLGSYYLEDLLKDFDGFHTLAISSYNAGPHNVKKWIRRFGDPRKMDNIAVIDWIEKIPFYETRNYVHRVLEAIQIYKIILGEDKKIKNPII